MGCPECRNSGRIVLELPVFADGGYRDVEQIDAPCACNPDPSDDDLPEWWDCDLPGIDFDVPFCDARYEGM
jgi:hypothetical protein